MPACKEKRIRPVIEEVTHASQAPVAPETSEPHQVQPLPVLAQSPEEQAKAILHEPGKTNYKLILLITVASALVVGFVAGGVYVYFSGLSQIDQEPPRSTQALATISPTETPEPSPAPPARDIDVSNYRVSVLNGSGKIGAAGSAASLLKEGGFEVANIGNASRYDYKETVIEVKDTVPEQVVRTLENALSKSYSVEMGEPIPSTSGYDIVVTVGSS